MPQTQVHEAEKWNPFLVKKKQIPYPTIPYILNYWGFITPIKDQSSLVPQEKAHTWVDSRKSEACSYNVPEHTQHHHAGKDKKPPVYVKVLIIISAELQSRNYRQGGNSENAKRQATRLRKELSRRHISKVAKATIFRCVCPPYFLFCRESPLTLISSSAGC